MRPTITAIGNIQRATTQSTRQLAMYLLFLSVSATNKKKD